MCDIWLNISQAQTVLKMETVLDSIACGSLTS